MASASPPSATPSARADWPDLLRALACLFIVAHHLAFYGPMSDAALPLAPDLMAWLYDHARLAVQVFLVCAGFLVAPALVRERQLTWPRMAGLLGRRFLRLALPLWVVLAIWVVLAEALRPIFSHDSLSATVGGVQALAHAFLLTHLLGHEALSAGLWYVAIDVQLFALALLLVGLAQRAWPRPLRQHAALRWPILVMAMALGSLLLWNRNAALDNWGLYFFGAYGLGMLAWWTRQADGLQRGMGWLTLLVLGALALWLEMRTRIALAWGVALWLAWSPALPAAWRTRAMPWVQALAQRSYALFLVHFPVSVLVSALVLQWAGSAPWPNALGMLASVIVSLLAAQALYRWVESAAWRTRGWPLALLALALSVPLAQGLAQVLQRA
ncbi:MAG: hypothetical protein RIQ97_2325 [Pseudomonadota bacterium]|jgi:peptidoglycan/LPS O-acetylase OafA/YrhL